MLIQLQANGSPGITFILTLPGKAQWKQWSVHCVTVGVVDDKIWFSNFLASSTQNKSWPHITGLHMENFLITIFT